MAISDMVPALEREKRKMKHPFASIKQATQKLEKSSRGGRVSSGGALRHPRKAKRGRGYAA